MSTAPSETPTTVSLADEEAVKHILIDTLFGLWATVNNLTRLRPSRRERYRVTVFGSARTEPGHWVYDEVKQMCAALSAMNCDIITGGGPGLMQAANEGASAAQAAQGVQSIGIRVHLPFEQNVNPFVEQAFEHATFFTRLHQFVLMSDAYIVVPGGLGTVLESMMIWQLLQVRHLPDTPLIFAGPMWRGYVASRIRTGEAGGHANTTLRRHQCGSRSGYPRPPRTLVAGQELLRRGRTQTTRLGASAVGSTDA
jgi:predicted Rossmann-fold nucleotide-binding protein